MNRYMKKLNICDLAKNLIFSNNLNKELFYEAMVDIIKQVFHFASGRIAAPPAELRGRANGVIGYAVHPFQVAAMVVPIHAQQDIPVLKELLYCLLVGNAAAGEGIHQAHVGENDVLLPIGELFFQPGQLLLRQQLHR